MKFRKKPIVIEAFQMGFDVTPDWYTGKGCWGDNGETWEIIETLEGNMKVGVGDWVIKGVNGEIYPCKPDIFEKTYELVDAPQAEETRNVSSQKEGG